MTQRHAPVALAAVISLLTILIVLPHAQSATNSHVGYGGLAALVYSFGGLGALARGRGRRLASLILAASLLGWAWRLYTLPCIGCLNSG